ncbi:MAG: SPOR domain-containing protein [Planctomycetes bacterium]|nr:SPOR domain-containing protein [Planctomycetota bacterium]
MNISIAAPASSFRSWRRRLLRLAGLIAIAGAAACQTTHPDRLDPAIASYESKNWQQSLDQASEVQKDSSGTVRDQAAFLAGLSAYQLGNYDEAQSRFQVSEQSGDAQTAGESKVMLGDLMVHRSRYPEAANYYDAAAGKLSGESAQRARDLAAASRDPSRAGKILAMAGPSMSINGSALETPKSAPSPAPAAAPSSGFEKDSSPAPAEKSKKSAKVPAAKPTKPAKAADDTPGKPAKNAGAAASKSNSKNAGKKADADAFVIQAGSFVLETSAKNRAKELTKAAARFGIDAPRVAAAKSRSGQKVWNVYLGGFESRAAAEKAIKQLGRKDLAVVTNPN